MRHKRTLSRNTLLFVCIVSTPLAWIGADTSRAEAAVSGTIASDTVWYAAESPYLVDGDLRLAEGATLTVEPGVVVVVSPGKTILLEGTLVALGKEDAPITFTGSAADPWGVLHFTDFIEDAVVDEEGNYVSGSVLQHCIVEYGKGIFCRFGSPLIAKCTIRRNQSSGIRVELGSPLIVDNLIYENSTETDPASGNGAGIIAFTDKAMTIARNVVWDNRSVDGRYGGGGICAYAYDNGSIDIVGNRVFNNYSSTHAGGIFAYKSTVHDNLVVGNRCEQEGGGINVIESIVIGNTVDSNSATSGGGIYAQNSELGFNSVVRNRTGSAGAASSYGGAIYFFGSGKVYHNTIMHNRSEAASRSGGIYASGSPSFTGNTICANGGFALFVGNPTHSPLLDARENYWGSPGGKAIVSALYDWFDDSERGLVDYAGFLDAPREDAPPIPPTGVTLALDEGGIEVRWSHSASQDVAGYRVHYDSDSGYPYRNAVEVEAGDSHVITDLDPGSDYYIAVTALKRDSGKRIDESAFSEELRIRFTGAESAAPARPANLSPEKGKLGVSVEPALTATAFTGAEAGHSASRWQIAAEAGGYGMPLFDSGPSGAPTDSLSVPPGILENGRRYFWRVCYRDERGNWSRWSSETAFATAKGDASILRGPLPPDSRWSPEENPYILAGNTLVPDGATLTVEPGVTVRVAPGASLMVRGKILAIGERDKPITFTRDSDEGWGQFIFADASADAVFDEAGDFLDGSIMKHCVVEYGRGVVVEASSPFLTESTIRYHEGSGLSIKKGGPTVSLNHIIGNRSPKDGGGIYVYTNDLAYIRDNLIKDNKAAADGGGIFAYGYRSTTAINILGNVVSGNTSGGNGGGIYASRATIMGNEIADNQTNSQGGGVYATFCIVDRNTLKGNTAEQGGGLFAERNSTIRHNTVIENASSSSHGGGVYINYWGASFENEEFTFNSVWDNRAASESDNGGVFVNGTLIFEKNNIFDNLGYELYNGNPADGPSFEARVCYWGTKDKDSIEDEIFHNPDDGQLGKVVYEPFVSEKWKGL